MRYRRFIAWNAVGGLVWGIGVVVIGWLAGNSFARVEQAAGTAAAIAVAAIVLAVLVVWAVRNHRREVEEERATAGEPEPPVLQDFESRD